MGKNSFSTNEHHEPQKDQRPFTQFILCNHLAHGHYLTSIRARAVDVIHSCGGDDGSAKIVECQSMGFDNKHARTEATKHELLAYVHVAFRVDTRQNVLTHQSKKTMSCLAIHVSAWRIAPASRGVRCLPRTRRFRLLGIFGALGACTNPGSPPSSQKTVTAHPLGKCLMDLVLRYPPPSGPKTKAAPAERRLFERRSAGA